MDKAQEWGDRIPIGVFYKNELESTFIDRIVNRIPFYRSNPPAKQKISDENGFSTADLRDFFDELRTS
jgi:2-oxoglutarate ferredoxin oxidoreductase subunit beta